MLAPRPAKRLSAAAALQHPCLHQPAVAIAARADTGNAASLPLAEGMSASAPDAEGAKQAYTDVEQACGGGSGHMSRTEQMPLEPPGWAKAMCRFTPSFVAYNTAHSSQH